jgi:phosphomannomutase
LISIFLALTNSAKETNTKKYHIAFQCEGRKPFNNDKFIWKYEFPERFLKSNRYKTKITNKIGVSQFSKDGILIAHYNSINEAQRKTGVLDLLLKVQNIKIDNKIPLDELKGYTALVTELEDKKIRVLIRYSGTENLLRILLEGQDEKLLEESMEKTVKFFKSALNE